jgi:hypothetical protein
MMHVMDRTLDFMEKLVLTIELVNSYPIGRVIILSLFALLLVLYPTMNVVELVLIIIDMGLSSGLKLG